MKLDISWHNLERSDSVEADVQKRFEKLQQFCEDITGARISLDQPHHPDQKPRKYGVVLELHVPDSTIIVDHAGNSEVQGDLHQLVHHTFDAARRQVQDYSRIRQGKVKRHSKPVAPLVDDDINHESTD